MNKLIYYFFFFLSRSFDLAQKRLDLGVVLHKAAEKAVIHQVKNLKKAFIVEEKGEHIIKVILSLFSTNIHDTFLVSFGSICGACR